MHASNVSLFDIDRVPQTGNNVKSPCEASAEVIVWCPPLKWSGRWDLNP